MRRRSLAILAMTIALLAFPLGALASHQFGDVPDSNPFHADIDAVADAGVTSGCGGGNFCPSANVTREQMAAFMNRLGALAPGKTPVVNATKIDGFSSADLNRVGFSVNTLLIDPALAPTTGSLFRSVAVPAKGYLIISGNITLYNPAASTAADSTCVLRFEGQPNLPGSYHQTSTGSPGGTHIWVNQCTSQTVTEVCVAGVYNLEFYVQAGTGDTWGENATLIVQYVPFNESGFQPACASS